MQTSTNNTVPIRAQHAPNLWDKALNTLDDEFRKTLACKPTGKRIVLEGALKAAEEKKRLCMLKRWKYKRRNGEEVIIRDVCEKIISWIEKFIAVGDVAMQYDPGHASLPWAGVRFLLQVATNDMQVFGAMTEGLETIAHMITRYATFEVLYLQTSSAVRSELEDALVALYAAVLIYIAKAKRYFQSSTTERLVKSAFLFGEDTAFRIISTREAKVSELASLVDSEKLGTVSEGATKIYELLKSLEEPIKRVADQPSLYMHSLREEKLSKILRWLSSMPYSQHQQRHSETRIPGSGKWLLESPQYLRWRSSSASSILLLHGIQGCGKTILASTIVDTFLNENATLASPAPLAYFYCERNASEPGRSDVDQIMRSLVRQLSFSSQDLKARESIVTEFDRRETSAKLGGFDVPELSLAECVKIVLELLRLNPANIIVDAVDECEEARRHELLQALNLLVKESSSVIKILVTTRTAGSILAQCREAAKIQIHFQDTQNDMECFIRTQVDAVIHGNLLLKGDVSASLRKSLLCGLLENAKEMFLWVKLQIHNLCRMTHEADVQRAIGRLSQDTLDQLYAKVYGQVLAAEPSARGTALKVFSWLLCMREPLPPDVLMAAVTIDESGHHLPLTLSDVLDICFNLITLDSYANILRFAHASVQEYIGSQPHHSQSEINATAASACLRACIRGPSLVSEPDNQGDSLYRYSAMYWANHCSLVEADDLRSEIGAKICEFVFEEEQIGLCFIGWVEDVRRLAEALENHHPLKKALCAVPSPSCTPLFVACVFGLSDLVQQLARWNLIEWDERNDLGATGIYLASRHGHAATVKMLIGHGANVNAEGGKYGNSLQAACFGGHTTTVRQLLESGADPMALGPLGNALLAAILGDQEDVARFLVGAKFPIPNQDAYDTAVDAAAQAGFQSVVSALQKNYAKEFVQDESAPTRALQAAVLKGQQGVLNRLLADKQGTSEDTLNKALQAAALGGHDSMVKALLQKGAQIEAHGRFGKPLRAAALTGMTSTTRLLLDNGAKVSESGALQAAALKGHTSTVELLLHEGGNTNERSGYFGNALQAAAFRGHMKIVELLLDAGADMHSGGLYKDAFQAAVEGGQETVVRQFLDRGYSVRMPVMIMCAGGQTKFRERKNPPADNILRAISPSRSKTEDRTGIEGSGLDAAFEHSSNWPYIDDLDALSDSYEGGNDYFLAAAASKGHISIVELLLKQRAFLRIGPEEIGEALEQASGKGHIDVLKLLLQAGVDCSPYLKTAVAAAASHGLLDVVEWFFTLPNTSDLKVSLYEAAALAASAQGQERVVSFALGGTDAHAAFDLRCRIRRQTLLEAAGNGQDGIVRMLLRSGTDLEAVESETCFDPDKRRFNFEGSRRTFKQSPLFAAASNGYETTVRLLLAEACAPAPPTELAIALKYACKLVYEPIVTCIIEYDSQRRINLEDYEKATIAASKTGNAYILRLLLTHISYSLGLRAFAVALFYASGNGHRGLVEMLLSVKKRMKDDCSIIIAALHIAANNGHHEVVAVLLEENINLNMPWRSSEVGFPEFEDLDPGAKIRYRFGHIRCGNVLHAAMFGFYRFADLKPHSNLWSDSHGWQSSDLSGQEATVQLLLDRGAEVNAQSAMSDFPLHIAAACCSETIVEALIRSGANVNASGGRYGTALRAAVMRTFSGVPIIKTLLKNGARIHAPSSDYGSALEAALDWFEPPRGRFYSRSENQPLIQTILDDGPGAAVRFLLDQQPKLQAKGPQYGLLLRMAASIGHQDYMYFLLRRHVDVNKHGNALQAAASFGNRALVELLLGYGADPNPPGEAHNTPLHAAVLGGHQSVAQILLAAGADVNADIDRLGHVLFAACESGDYDMLKILLNAGANVNVSGKRSWENVQWDKPLQAEDATPLHKAASKGDEAVVKALLAAGAEVDKRVNDTGKAASKEIEAEVKAIRAGFAMTDKQAEDTGTALQVGCNCGQEKIVRLLVQAGADLNCRGGPFGTALAAASFNGHDGIVQYLLESGAKVEAECGYHGNAVAAASVGGHWQVVECLFDRISGTESEESICSGLFAQACARKDVKACRLLLERRLKPSPLALLQASAGGLEAIIELLIDAGVDVNAGDNENGHPLHAAAYGGRVGAVQALINHSADVCVWDDIYGSPVTAALEGYIDSQWYLNSQTSSRNFTSLPSNQLQGQYEKVIQIMLDCGAEVNPEKVPGPEEDVQLLSVRQARYIRAAELKPYGSALHLASFAGTESMTRILLDNGADMHAKGGRFETALQAAVEGNKVEIVRLLLDRGFDANVESRRWGNILQCACVVAGTDIIERLLSHGAHVNFSGGPYGGAFAAALQLHRWDVVLCLLQEAKSVQVEQEEFLDIMERQWSWDEAMSLLLTEHQNIQVTEEILVDALKKRCSEDLVNLMLTKYGDGPVTQDMIKVAGDEKMMKSLLDRSQGMRIHGDVFTALATCPSWAPLQYKPAKLISLLLEHDKEVSIPKDALLAAAKNSKHGPEILATFLEHDPKLEIDEHIIVAMAENVYDRNRMLRSTLERGYRVPFTKKIQALCKGWQSVDSYEQHRRRTIYNDEEKKFLERNERSSCYSFHTQRLRRRG